MITHKRRYPYIGHHRRFTLLKPPTRPTASAREIARLEAENAALRKDMRSVGIWASMDVDMYDPLELLDRIQSIADRVLS